MTIVVALALSALGGLPVWPSSWWHTVPRATGASGAGSDAERCQRRAALELLDARVAAGLPVDPGAPRDEAAWIGSELTPFVTTLGHLEAKRTAAMPAWSRVLAHEFAGRGLGPGSVIAANFSGSFPALNVAVVCAAQSLGARVAAASSVTASTWGATDPGFTWPEVEVRLVRAGIIRPASVLVSVGGDGDRGLDLEADARTQAVTIARRSAAALGAEWLDPANYDEAVRRRLAGFERAANGRRLAVFVNVGGAEASLGHDAAILDAPGGWVTSAPAGVRPGEGGLVAEFLARGTPVLHLLNVRALALRWKLRW